jgi:hypothetical protein
VRVQGNENVGHDQNFFYVGRKGSKVDVFFCPSRGYVKFGESLDFTPPSDDMLRMEDEASSWKSFEYAIDETYTINADRDTHAYLLDMPYGNGTYREVFEEMRKTLQILVGLLIDEFVHLLQMDDAVVVRKAAAIKFISRLFIGVEGMLLPPPPP